MTGGVACDSANVTRFGRLVDDLRFLEEDGEGAWDRKSRDLATESRDLMYGDSCELDDVSSSLLLASSNDGRGLGPEAWRNVM